MSRDNDIYVAAVDLLKATNAFTEVTYGEPLNVGPTPADTQYLCVINHTSDRYKFYFFNHDYYR